jgi:hypothetical protein
MESTLNTTAPTVRHKTIIEHDTLSFHALRAKFQPSHHVKKAPTSVDFVVIILFKYVILKVNNYQ